MDKYEKLKRDLEQAGTGQMRCAGNSMLPILTNPSTCVYASQASYAVGDIVFCKVRGRYIDAHKVVRVAADGQYLIANNKGHENGWTAKVYGRVTKAYDKSGRLHYER